jgi:tetratricopeptide (TPR) repeat protein
LQFDETITNRVTIKAEALASGFCLDDRYEIMQKLGEGLMTVVYRARHLQLNREVALKILHEHLADDPEAIKRFQQEAAAISALEHENIVKVYGSGVWQSRPYISTELVDGISLANMLEVDRHLPKEQAVPIFLQILDGLAHAHSRGIIHRDIRPSNIMLTNGVKTVKIIDFGIAKILPESGKHFQTLTQTGHLFGTLMYMSPERCMGFPATVKSDLYSMGCLMYETLAGIRPVQGQTDAALIDQQVKKTPERHPLLNDDLGNVILWCLAKDPARRPESAAELKSAILQPQKFRRANAAGRRLVRAWLIAATIICMIAAAAITATRITPPHTEPVVSKEEMDDAFDRARTLRDARKPDEAAPVYEALIEKLNACARTDNRLAVILPLLRSRLELGGVFLQQNKDPQAEAQVMQVLAAFDRHPAWSRSVDAGVAYSDGLNLMGDLAFRKGKLNEALNWDIRNVTYLRGAPGEVRRWNYVKAQQRLGESYLHTGNLSDAILYLQAAIRSADEPKKEVTPNWSWSKKRAQLCLAEVYLAKAMAAGDGQERNRQEMSAIKMTEQFAASETGFDYRSMSPGEELLITSALKLAKTQTDSGQAKNSVRLLTSIEQMQERTNLKYQEAAVKTALAQARADR